MRHHDVETHRLAQYAEQAALESAIVYKKTIRTETGLTVALSAEKDRVTLLQHTLDSTLEEKIAITHELKNGTFTLTLAQTLSVPQR
jgi:hypothetical protein